MRSRLRRSWGAGGSVLIAALRIPGQEDAMTKTKVEWAPWEERTIEGFGPVVKVEVCAPIAFEVRELAVKLGQTPGDVLNLALQFGLVMVRDQGTPPESPS
jgi:hypothetical protein